MSSVTLTANVTVYAKWNALSECPFENIAQDDWPYEALVFTRDKELVSGTGGEAFSTYLDTTRGMIVTIQWRLERSPSVEGKAPFADVAVASYCYETMLWASENGSVLGFGDKAFHPGLPVTREQLAAIICHHANYKRYDTTPRTDLSGFIDADRISAWAMD